LGAASHCNDEAGHVLNVQVLTDSHGHTCVFELDSRASDRGHLRCRRIGYRDRDELDDLLATSKAPLPVREPILGDAREPPISYAAQP
jgi:hypothetical protein